ncbi:MAG: hypothetical protein AABY49_11415, partial [Planctomycetota bacterium]
PVSEFRTNRLNIHPTYIVKIKNEIWDIHLNLSEVIHDDDLRFFLDTLEASDFCIVFSFCEAKSFLRSK